MNYATGKLLHCSPAIPKRVKYKSVGKTSECESRWIWLSRFTPSGKVKITSINADIFSYPADNININQPPKPLKRQTQT